MTAPDPELFRQACQGDRDAFWQLIVPYRGLVYSVAFGMLKNHEQAEDKLHDVLVVACRALPNLRDPKRLPGWLYSITRNHIRDGMRRAKRLRLATNEIAARTAEVVRVSEMAEKEAWLTQMEESMRHLPEPFRIILGMKYMNAYSCRQIAEILDISVPAVKSRLFEARKLLRRRMEALDADSPSAAHGKGVE